MSLKGVDPMKGAQGFFGRISMTAPNGDLLRSVRFGSTPPGGGCLVGGDDGRNERQLGVSVSGFETGRCP